MLGIEIDGVCLLCTFLGTVGSQMRRNKSWLGDWANSKSWQYFGQLPRSVLILCPVRHWMLSNSASIAASSRDTSPSLQRPNTTPENLHYLPSRKEIHLLRDPFVLPAACLHFRKLLHTVLCPSPHGKLRTHLHFWTSIWSLTCRHVASYSKVASAWTVSLKLNQDSTYPSSR